MIYLNFSPSLWSFPSLTLVFSLSLFLCLLLQVLLIFWVAFSGIFSAKNLPWHEVQEMNFSSSLHSLHMFRQLKRYCIWTYASLGKICVCTTESRIGLKSASKGNWVGSCNSDLFPFPAAMSWIRRELMNSARFPSVHQSPLNTHWRREMK